MASLKPPRTPANSTLYSAHPWAQYVIFTQDPTALKALGRTYELNLDLTDTDGACWNTKRPYVIWVKPGAGVPVLVHECTHATLNILKYCGIDPQSADGEPMCYTLQRMLECFLPQLQK